MYIRVTEVRTQPYDKPGYAKKHFTGVVSSYQFGKRKIEERNFDGFGSNRVTVHRGYSVDVWEYYTKRAVANHKARVAMNASIALGALGMCLVDAILD